MAGYIVPNMQDYKHGFELKLFLSYFFLNLIVKYETCIKDKNSVIRNKQYTDFFYFYILKDFHLKSFHKFLTKGNSWRDHAK